MDFDEENLRTNLYDFGYQISTSEMSRDFYLKNRLNKEERKNLVDILDIFRKQTLKARYKISSNRYNLPLWVIPSAFNFGVLAVGTSVYSDDYFEKLENCFIEKGFDKEDFLEEESGSYEKQEREFETYKDYLDWCNLPEAFDEKITPIPKKIFNKRKKKNQIPSLEKKKIKDILDRKGEDLDFVICPDTEIDCSADSIKKIGEYFFGFMNEAGYKIKSEYDCLYGVNYFFPEGKIVRYKSIESWVGHETSYKISFTNLRDFHFYFNNQNLNLKIRKERIENYSFCQILRRRNTDDLKSAIKNGEEKGIFENPEYLNFKKI